MKKYLIILAAFAFSCSKKEPCEYDKIPDGIVTPPVSGCVEVEPAGYMVNTMSTDDPTGNVGIVFDVSKTYKASIGVDWFNVLQGANRVPSIQPAMWKKNIIGSVFGIALDNKSGIFLSASNIYNDPSSFGAGASPSLNYGAGGAAGIYYTDILNPATTTTLVKTDNVSVGIYTAARAYTVGTNTIPNAGNSVITSDPETALNSIGNIAYDKTNNQLFATNLEDGRIYRINSSTGIIKSVFDPFVIDNNVAGIVSLNERVLGIGVLIESGVTKVYFARSIVGGKEIWSISLDASGEFTANVGGSGFTKLYNDSASSSKLEVANVQGLQKKITDIAFSSQGKMLLAEKGHPHLSGVFEYTKTGSSWLPSVYSAGTGTYVGGHQSPSYATTPGRNSAGGIDYGNRQTIINNAKCDDLIWATGHFLAPVYTSATTYSGAFYGVQGLNTSGNSSSLPTNSLNDLYIDYDGATTTIPKGSIGDVEIFDSKCPCNN